MKFISTFWLFCGLCISISQLSAQGLTFQKTYGGAGNQIGNYVLEAAGGGYLIAGTTANPNSPSDGYLLRVGTTGDILWQVRVGGNNMDAFNVVKQASDGGFIALGETSSSGAGNNDIWIVKVTANGVVEWERTFGGVNADLGRALVVIPGGYVISGGQASAGFSNLSTFVIRLNTTGGTIWSKTYFTGISNLLHVEYAEGNVLYASGGADTRGAFATLDASTGNVLSALSFGDLGPEALYYSQPTLDGNLVLANHTWSVTGGAEFRYWVRKVTKDGSPIWSKTYGIPGLMMRGRIETVSDGGFLLNPRQDNASLASNDAYLVKLNAAGDIVWAYNYGSPSTSEVLSRAEETADSGFVAVGQYRSVGGNTEILLLKTDAQGQIAGCCSQPSPFVTINFENPNETFSLSDDSFFTGQDATLQSAVVTFTGTDYCPNSQPADSISVNLCAGQTFAIGGTSYSAPAVVNDTIAGTAGCDSVVTYTLTLSPSPTLTDTFSFCPNGAITLNGVTYTQPGIVLDTLPAAAGGCDTLATYVLQLLPQPALVDTIVLCPGDSVSINGVTYYQPGTVNTTLPASNGGCDTLATYHLLRGDHPTIQQTVSFCPGDAVVVNGVSYTQGNTAISYVIPAGSGCDTLVEVFLTFSPQPTATKAISFCPGDSVNVDGAIYSQPGTVSGVITASTGCDTLVTYVLQFLPQPTVTRNIAFCPGDSVTIAGTTYSQPGTASGVISASAGCDTLVTYVLLFSPQPTISRTIAFCPGDSVTIAGTTYSQPGTVSGVISASAGCDTLVTYVLLFSPQPTLNQTVEFCAGDSVVIGGVEYSQPGTVNLLLPSTTGGCDTLATYLLEYTVPGNPTAITITCPSDIYVDADPGEGSVVVNYATITANSDCPCPGVALTLQAGLVSGSSFPLDTTNVCYNAQDSCGNSITCCFSVTVESKAACDTKVINCIKYELLSITQDAQQRKTYRIRTTNNCANRLIYMAIQVPDGLVADLPGHNTIYAAPTGRTYLVRNPNYSPFYSVRYSSVSDSIRNGESDVFKYTLPPQADPDYIHVMVRLEPNIYHEAHLNTFYCPIEYEANSRAGNKTSRQAEQAENAVHLFPNPSDGTLFADLSVWSEQVVQIRIFSAQGHLLQVTQVLAGDRAQLVDLPASPADGLYLLEVTPPNGKKSVQKFFIQR